MTEGQVRPAAPDWTGRTVELEVGAVAHGGHCVARFDNRVVFVRHALPGERVVAEITEDKGGSFCRADAVTVLMPAAQRVEPPCPLAAPGACGGCDWQHADPAFQRELKARVVAEQLHRLAGLDSPEVQVEALPPAETPVPPENSAAGEGLRWRSRVRLVADRQGRAGLRAHHSHRVIPLADCPITLSGTVDGTLARRWRPGSEIEVTRDDEGTVHARELTTVRGRNRSRQLVGGQAVQHAAGRRWELDAHGFWQGHPAAAGVLAEVVGGWARVPEGGRAWDLYAGVGLFASVLAGQAGKRGQVLAVESVPRAVADGRRNLADLPQVHWRAGRVERVLAGLDERPDVVVLDPPRRGAGRAVVESIVEAAPARVVYVACDPAALARDVAIFGEHGYRLAGLRAFDAFPMTQHVECVALLQC